MKKLLLLCCLLLPLFARAQEEPAPSPAAVEWMVRVEMLVVNLPQEKALALLPELRDEAKIEGAYRQIMQAIQRQEATLVGYPMLNTLDRQRATVETVDELIYPTRFVAPVTPASFNAGASAPAAPTPTPPVDVNVAACPLNFERRNVGVTLELEAVVQPGGKWISLNIQPQHVAFQGFEWYETLKTPKLTGSVPQPRFFTTKVSTSVWTRNGQRMLFGFHKLKKPEGQVELSILQIAATRIGE